MAECTQRNQNSDSNNSLNCLVEAIPGIATKQRSQTDKMLKPISTDALIFDGKNDTFEIFEDILHIMLKMQPDMIEAMKNDHFHAYF